MLSIIRTGRLEEGFRRLLAIKQTSQLTLVLAASQKSYGKKAASMQNKGRKEIKELSPSARVEQTIEMDIEVIMTYIMGLFHVVSGLPRGRGGAGRGGGSVANRAGGKNNLGIKLARVNFLALCSRVVARQSPRMGRGERDVGGVRRDRHRHRIAGCDLLYLPPHEEKVPLVAAGDCGANGGYSPAATFVRSE